MTVLNEVRDAIKKPPKVNNRIIEPPAPQYFDQYVEHSFSSFPLEKLRMEISEDLQRRILAMEAIDDCPSMLHFVMIHKIQPKIYMLRSDAELDHEEYARQRFSGVT